MNDLTANLVPLLAALVITLAALLLAIIQDWRVSIACLSVQYLGVFILATLEWPLTMAITRLISGWMAGAILGMAIGGTSETGNIQLFRRYPRYRTMTPYFFLIASLLSGIVILAQIPSLMRIIPDLTLAQSWGVLILIGMGLFAIGFADSSLMTITGLLTILSGASILVTVLNSAGLTAGLLAVIDLAIALAGAYLILAPGMEAGE